MPFVQFPWDCICLLRHRGKVTARAFLFNTKELLVFKNDLETAGQVFDLTMSVHAIPLVWDSSNRASGQLAQCMQWRWVKWNADFKWEYWHNSISIRQHWNSSVKLYTNNRGNQASRGVTLQFKERSEAKRRKEKKKKKCRETELYQQVLKNPTISLH